MNYGYIYLITNKINNKKYIGQTRMTVQERWHKHCSVARNNLNATGIDGAIKKYGEENFSVEIIKECPIDELNKWEIYYIQYYNTYQGNNDNIGYNITLGGQGGYIYDIDEDEMLQMYLEGKTAKELSEYYGCSDKTIGDRLAKYNINTKEHQRQWLINHPEIWKNNLKKETSGQFKKGDNIKPVYIKELNISFPSLKDCSQWLIDNNYTTTKNMEAVRKSLSRHLNGERASYLKMHFEFI